MIKQNTLWEEPNRIKSYGGDTLAITGKVQRPFVSSNSHHVVLYASHSYFSQRENRELTERLLIHYSTKYFIRLYRFSINSNHQHLLLNAPNRFAFQNFLRVYPGQVSQQILKCKRGRPLTNSFWQKLAWSREVTWGRDFDATVKYVEQNRMEYKWEINYKPR